MNRMDLRQLAEDRLQDAAALLAAHRWSGAYYVAGYAVECGLKACIARLTHAEDFPPKGKVGQDCYTHDLERLLKAGGLKPNLDAAVTGNPLLAGNWSVVKDWSEESRYEQKTPAEAQALYAAITDSVNGVMPWIRTHW